MRKRPSTCALERVYDADTLTSYVEHLAKQPAPPDSEHVRARLNVLTAHGPAPIDPEAARLLKQRRAKRAALEAYVETAHLCSLLDANMVERLRSTEEPNFRSALAECLTCWVFAGMLRYQVTPRVGGGRPGKQLEFAVATSHETLSVEVKAPAADLPDGAMRIWAGDDSHILEKAVRDAASQFGHGTKNLLVIVPTLRTSVWTQRSQLVKALIGEPVVHIYVPVEDDRASYSEPGFAPRGRLVRPGKKGPHGEPLPAHTRVSAVMVIEVVHAERAEREPPVGEDFGRQLEAWVERRYSADNTFWPEYRITVVHNPNAECPLAPETLARFPQLLKAPEGAMTWSDRDPNDTGNLTVSVSARGGQGAPFQVGRAPDLRLLREDWGTFSGLPTHGQFSNSSSRSSPTASVQPYMAPNLASPDLTSRIQGCLLGGAVGDALGAPVEFLSLADITARFGVDGITDYAHAYGGLGRVTDDTQMTLFTAEGLVRAHVRGSLKGISSTTGVVAHSLQRWLKTQGVDPHAKLGFAEDAVWPDGWLVQHRELWSRRAPGNTCLSSLAAMEALGAQASNDSKGCGGVMRVAPAGLLYSARADNPFMSSGDELSPAFTLGRDLSRATHGHRASLLASGAMAHLVAVLVAGVAVRDAVLQTHGAVSRLQGYETLRGRLDLAVELGTRPGLGTAREVEQLGAAWVAEEALAIALYVALKATSFEHGMQLAVNHGGDSDSTGSMVGQLLGAAWGVQAIPRTWLDPLELRDVIEQLAADLEAVANGTFDPEAEWERYPGW